VTGSSGSGKWVIAILCIARLVQRDKVNQLLLRTIEVRGKTTEVAQYPNARHLQVMEPYTQALHGFCFVRQHVPNEW
jgi:hypothetical protein